MSHITRFIPIVLLVLTLSACGNPWDGSAQVAPTATRVPPTATYPPATETPVPAATVAPTARIIHWTATPAPGQALVPTATPVPGGSGAPAPTPAPASSGSTGGGDVIVVIEPYPVIPTQGPLPVSQPNAPGNVQRVKLFPNQNIWKGVQLDQSKISVAGSNELIVVYGDWNPQQGGRCSVRTWGTGEKVSPLSGGSWDIALVRGGDAAGRELEVENIREIAAREAVICEWVNKPKR